MGRTVGIPGTPFSPHSHWEDISPGDSRDFTGLRAIPGTQGMSLVDIGIVVANLDITRVTSYSVYVVCLYTACMCSLCLCFTRFIP